MGYTHYWEVKNKIPQDKFDAIGDDLKQVIKACNDDGIKICGGMGEIENDVISFNGDGDNGHETCYMTKDKKDFAFCKTARKPYDIAVTAFLIICKHYLGDDIEVTSDGDNEAFDDARIFCDKILGYGIDFVSDDEPQN